MNSSSNQATANRSSIILENGTIIGSITETQCSRTKKYTGDKKNLLIIPEIVISSSYSNNSLNRSSRSSNMLSDNKLATTTAVTTTATASPATKFLSCNTTSANAKNNNNKNNNSSNNEGNDTDADAEAESESIALLDAHSDVEHDIVVVEVVEGNSTDSQQQQRRRQTDEFDQFILNRRSTSESNVLDSSVYSELQFPPSPSSCETGVQQQQQQQQELATSPNSTPALTPPPPTVTVISTSNVASQPSSNSVVVADVLNSSACSRESRQNKRTRRKHKSKSKCNGTTASSVGTQRSTQTGVVMQHSTYPPQYTALFLDPHMQHHHHHHHHGAATNAIGGQIANPLAPAAPYALTTPSNHDATANNYMQQQYQQYYQQRPILTSVGHFNHHHRSLLDTVSNDVTNVTIPTTTSQTQRVNGISGTTRSFLTASSSPFRVCFRKWFSRPSLPFVIGILALGGVACTLGGIVLGSTGLVEHSTQYLSAALLMIGIGVSLLVISGAIWRLSLPDDVDECPCYRHMEACRNCNSPYCNNRLLPGSFLHYPEFQHRPPPPSYLTSLNECAAMGLLFHPAAQAQHAAVYSHPLQRISTPPPLYRSTNSLSIVMPNAPNPSVGPISHTSTGLLARQSATTAHSTHNDGMLSSQNVITMSAVMENIQAQTQQQFTKEINYLDLD